MKLTECLLSHFLKRKQKNYRKKAQQDAEARQYDWNDTNRIDIAKQIGKQAMLGACIAVGMQGARILARRARNRLNGRENPSTNEDLNEFSKARCVPVRKQLYRLLFPERS